MRVVIIEDETAAAQNLSAILHKVNPEVEIIDTIDTVVDSIDFFKSQPQLDLVFMDIHLADGSSFRIFDSVEVKTPIIFTTAYDQYAIEAFKVNSIDYLLKPINEESVRRAINKWLHLTASERNDYASRITQVAQEQRVAQQVFLVHFRDKIIQLSLDFFRHCAFGQHNGKVYRGGFITAYCFVSLPFPSNGRIVGAVQQEAVGFVGFQA